MRTKLIQLIIMIIIPFTWCLTVQADYSDADKAYKSGDYIRAFNEYKRFAELGDIRAQVNIGWMYYYGEGILQDKAQALVWYRKAAEQGDFTSMFNLAFGYEHGDGVKQDKFESRRWYGRAAMQSNVFERIVFERLTKQFLLPTSDQSRLFSLLDKN